MTNIQEDQYRSQLIDKGLPFAQAAEIARRTTEAQIRPQPGTRRQRATEQSTPFPDIEQPKECTGTGLSSQAEKLIRAAADIALEPPSGIDMAFTHAIFCQVGLPRSMVRGREFIRQSGAAWINIQAGFLDEGNGPVPQCIPYGVKPRLALAWISTYAKRNNTREVPIGKSASDFLRLLGQTTSGGKRGSFTSLRKQMHALAACRLQLGYMGRTFNGQPIEQFDAWVRHVPAAGKSQWPGVILLSESYFQELALHGVPLDNRALHALKGSALALDVYTWLAHRLHRIDGRPRLVYWPNLYEQFGAQDYHGKNARKDFRDEFLKALQSALAAYPLAKARVVAGGLLLSPSPPPIPYKIS